MSLTKISKLFRDMMGNFVDYRSKFKEIQYKRRIVFLSILSLWI